MMARVATPLGFEPKNNASKRRAFTRVTLFRIFARNRQPDFTHYLCEQRKEN